MKITIKLENEWKDIEMSIIQEKIEWSDENTIVQSIKNMSYLLASQYAKETGKEKNDWVHTLDKRKDNTNIIELTPEELLTVRLIFKDCIANPFYYIKPYECLDGEVGLINARLVSKI